MEYYLSQFRKHSNAKYGLVAKCAASFLRCGSVKEQWTSVTEMNVFAGSVNTRLSIMGGYFNKQPSKY